MGGGKRKFCSEATIPGLLTDRSSTNNDEAFLCVCFCRVEESLFSSRYFFASVMGGFISLHLLASKGSVDVDIRHSNRDITLLSVLFRRIKY